MLSPDCLLPLLLCSFKIVFSLFKGNICDKIFIRMFEYLLWFIFYFSTLICQFSCFFSILLPADSDSIHLLVHAIWQEIFSFWSHWKTACFEIIIIQCHNILDALMSLSLSWIFFLLGWKCVQLNLQQALCAHLCCSFDIAKNMRCVISFHFENILWFILYHCWVFCSRS